jgi:threonine synthase
MGKYYLICKNCEASLSNFAHWFQVGQKCPECQSIFIEARYHSDPGDLSKLMNETSDHRSLWRYFDFLPLQDSSNIVSSGEGNVDVQRWPCLEDYALAHGINCKVYAHRHDNNPSTGTFKDLAGSMIASVLKESNIKSYVVASTGNIGVAFARYLAAADISLYVFIPNSSSRQHDAEIGIYGQKVFRVRGDYATAKRIAAEFAQKNNFYSSPGGFDPIRIEAKKTIGYEWFRKLDSEPTVYIQALSGGMGPLGIAKGLVEVNASGLLKDIPRFYLVQSDCCSPMAEAWSKAKNNNFTEGWKNDYPIIENPKTNIPTLATGNPGLFPLVGELVRKSGGEIVTFPEEYCVDVAKFIATETAVRVGPASAIAIGGFLRAVQSRSIGSGDIVVVSVGEGIRRNPDFMLEMAWSSVIESVDECQPIGRQDRRDTIMRNINNIKLD